MHTMHFLSPLAPLLLLATSLQLCTANPHPNPQVTTTVKPTTTKTTTTKTTTTSWQVSGSAISCPHPAVNTVFPSATVTVSFPTASVVSGTFDGGMRLYDRAGSPGDCKGQTELDEAAAVFILEPGATVRNLIIGARQVLTPQFAVISNL